MDSRFKSKLGTNLVILNGSSEDIFDKLLSSDLLNISEIFTDYSNKPDDVKNENSLKRILAKNTSVKLHLISKVNSLTNIEKIVNQENFKPPKTMKDMEKLFSNLVEPYLIQPTFVTEYPVEISPLARYKRGEDSNQYVERFELFIAGLEFANSFSELNDPFEQKNRLLNQQKMLQKGDAEAQVFDKDFIEVLEAGMPPTGGVGIGVDRMVMLFTEQDSIKDVIFFPSMRDE